jgi:hypothetical protein
VSSLSDPLSSVEAINKSTNQPPNMMPGYWHPVQLPNYLTSYLLTIDGGILGVMEELTDYEINHRKISVFNLL